jgi:hypothetical protein
MYKRKTAVPLKSDREGIDVYGIELPNLNYYIKFLGRKSEIHNALQRHFPDELYNVGKYKYGISKVVMDIDDKYRLELKL